MSEDTVPTETGSGPGADGPLAGTRVVEVAMWVYVPAAGVVLRDWGADVTKVESPHGDPLRTLTWGGIPPTAAGSFMWGLYNRGKRSIAIDLRREQGQGLLYELVKDTDVFLVSLLPETRQAFKIDVDHIRAHNPEIVYAIGSGQGYVGPDANRGGYDGITFWYRGGVGESVTPPGEEWPLGMPVGGFGDTLSGMTLAGGIAAALARKARTGRGSVVDGSLLATSLWAMAPGVAASSIAKADVTGTRRRTGAGPESAFRPVPDVRQSGGRPRHAAAREILGWLLRRYWASRAGRGPTVPHG